MSIASGNIEPASPGGAASPAVPAARSLLKPFNRAGAPSIVDLGFDAQGGGEQEDEPDSQNTHDLIGFPGERAPHISFGFEGERWRMRNVVWVISQSQLGHALLDHSYRAGYRLGFDTMVSTGERIESFVNYADRVITLDPRAANEQMVVALALQLGFASAAVDGTYFDASFTPPSALATHRLAAACAHALQLQVCFELKNSPTLPATTDREAYWRLSSKEYPRLSSGFVQSAINEMALEQGAAMASAIREFYSHEALRSRYDADVINFFRSLPQSILKDPKTMNLTADPAAQCYKLKFPGAAYAATHEPKLNLADPVNLGANAEVVAAVAALQAARRNAGVKDRDSWQIKEVQL